MYYVCRTLQANGMGDVHAVPSPHLPSMRLIPVSVLPILQPRLKQPSATCRDYHGGRHLVFVALAVHAIYSL